MGAAAHQRLIRSVEISRRIALKIPSELDKALSASRSAIANRKAITDAIDQAIAHQPAVEIRLQKELERFGDAEADSVLSGTPAQTNASREALQYARESADGLAARIAGLRRRLVLQEEEILAARAVLDPLREEFSRNCLSEFRTEYLKAAEQFAEIARKGAGLSSALGFPFSGLSELEFRDPETGLRIEIFSDNGKLHKTVIAARESIGFIRDQAETIGKLADDIAAARAAVASAHAQGRPSRDAQPGLLPVYSGLSDVEWRAENERAPRDMAMHAPEYVGIVG
jgi:hypothetical protein